MEATWLTDISFKNVVSNAWICENIFDCFQNFTKEAIIWNKNVFGDIFRKKKRLRARIEGIQKAQDLLFSHNLQNLERNIISDYNSVLMQEEILWFQKSHARWITSGECNTKYFLLYTVIRRRKANIAMLENSNNIWVDNFDLLKDMVHSFFNDLFTCNMSTSSSSLPSEFAPTLSHDDNLQLCALISNVEI